jgi:hypothetical protein
MHEIQPYANWLRFYDSSTDVRSPFHNKSYNYDVYSETVYGYYIDPAWDNFGSETLYLKILFADYDEGYAILEFIGEWNDAINNDIMTLKRSVIDILLAEGITKFILIGEHIFNFHGSDDSYYEAWFEELEDGWITSLNFPEFVIDEMKKFHLQNYINLHEDLYIEKWRTYQPLVLCRMVEKLITEG